MSWRLDKFCVRADLKGSGVFNPYSLYSSCPAVFTSINDVEDIIAFAPHFDGQKRIQTGDESMAGITALWLAAAPIRVNPVASPLP